MVAGIRHARSHSALDDAHAAASLLAGYIEAEPAGPPWLHVCEAAQAAGWPTLPVAAVSTVTRDAPAAGTDEHFVSRLVARLPRAGDHAADEYLDLLDRCLLDRHISTAETRALVEFAAGLGICGEEAADLHCRYLSALAVAAVADGVVTPSEQDDLTTVAGLLGLGHAHVGQALSEARSGEAGSTLPGFTLHPGDQVVFTGELDEPRDLWEARATALGAFAPAERDEENPAGGRSRPGHAVGQGEEGPPAWRPAGRPG
jgi:DNA polymerase-3 subunit epsilon